MLRIAIGAALCSLLAGCAVQHAKEDMQAARAKYDACLAQHAPGVLDYGLSKEESTERLMALCLSEGEAYEDAKDDYRQAVTNDQIRRQNLPATLAGAAALSNAATNRMYPNAGAPQVHVNVDTWNGRGPPPPP